MIGLLYVSGHLVFGRMPPLSLALLGSGVLWAIASLMIAFTEENLFRGCLLFTLGRGIGFWPAALLLAALFGMAHGTNAGETPIGLFSAGFYALVIALSIAYTRHSGGRLAFTPHGTGRSPISTALPIAGSPRPAGCTPHCPKATCI
ncbi:CPBP family glutamic-type intramembrane protease [Metallibacterium sp.]